MFVQLKVIFHNKISRLVVFLLTALLLVTQQCSDVRLKAPDFETEFQSRGFPYRLYPPSDYERLRRYVILVDMSKSMLSGPCPYDVGNSPYFHPDTSYRPFDPNKDTGSDLNDGRGAARSCYVDPDLPVEAGQHIVPQPYQFGMQYGTYKGNDYEGLRLKILEQWIDQLKNNLTLQARRNALIMIVPVSGGTSQVKLDNLDPISRKFVSIDDPKIEESFDMMRSENHRNLDLINNPSIKGRWDQLSMGTTAPGEILGDVYSQMDEDMRTLNDLGLLSQSSYKVMYLGDGMITPLEENQKDVLAINRFCNGEVGDSLCSTLIASMNRSWGEATLNTARALDLKLSLIQSLPKFYGSGLVEIDFLQLQPERTAKGANGQPNMFKTLAKMAAERQGRITIWDVDDQDPPFDLATPAMETKLYKMTNMFIFNPNVRVDLNGITRTDADGDGLFDEEERALGLDPYATRTNGYCLDSIMANGAFAQRCDSFAYGSACDPSLDSDGDGLNQCEEIILGTDSFDFDTDGDALPDFLEWLYGFNPLTPDTDLDTSGDGTPNLVNFSAGLGPMHYHGQIPNLQKSSYSIDFLDNEVLIDEELGQVQIEQYRVELKNILTASLPALDLTQRDQLYFSRLNKNSSNLGKVRIPEKHQLLNCSIKPLTNRVVALVRLVDEQEPHLASWRIMKFLLSEHTSGRGHTLDLSAFEQMKVMDVNYREDQ